MGENRPNELWRVVRRLQRLEYDDPEHAHELIDAILPDLASYSGPPGQWHTAAMVSGRTDHRSGRDQFVLAGLDQWPDDVDLLCEKLQSLYSGAGYPDPGEAAIVWDHLESLPTTETYPQWRFWSYGAVYHARLLGRTDEALRLLDKGIGVVRRESLADVIRAYRAVLVDNVPARELDSEEGVKDYQQWALRLLEERYRKALMWGVEHGYQIATALARLHMERAYSETPGETRDNLETALHYLDLAETLYTASP